MQKKLKSLIPHVISFLIMLICAVVYFLPQFQGKKLSQGDTINYKYTAHEVIDYKKKTGKDALWTNSIFCGMPSYQIKATNRSNLLSKVESITRLGMSRPMGYFLGAMVMFYISMLLLGIGHWVALLGAICFAFSTNNLVLYDAGHVTKVRTIFTVVPVITGVILTFRKQYLLGGILFALFFGINVLTNHPQMTYYLGMTLLIMVGLYLYQAIKNKELSHFLKTCAILAVGALLGIGSSASKIWSTVEYGEDTMRGKPILTNTDPSSSSSKDGLAWDYAMTYSNEKKDLLAGVIPLAIGGGSQEILGKDSETAKYLKKRGVNVRNGIPAPTYWGSLAINGGPQYFGAVICLLFLLAMFVLKGPIRWYGFGAVLLTFALSLGYNMEWFNRFLFDYFPMFNKFRTPNSVISLTAAIVPMIGFYGLHQYLKEQNKDVKPLLYAAGILVGICAIFGLGGSAIFDFSSASDPRMEQAGYNLDALIDDRKAMLMSSSLKSLALILLSAGAIYLYKINKLKNVWTILIIGLLAMFDLFSVSSRYLSHDDFHATRKYESNFAPRPVDEQILKDQDLYYRVMDYSINTFNSAQASYFHKTIGGAHAAKLQRIQDIIERHVSKNNRQVLNMLNTKYEIYNDEQNNTRAQINTAAMGNAWFINNIQIVDSADEEIAALTDFDEKGDAIIHKEFTSYIGGMNPQKEGSIRLTSYAPDVLEYESNTSSEQLGIFSEVWYGPDKGWQAYIDGAPVDHIRANYILRAMKVPAGSHKIRFEFKPKSYEVGEPISFVSSLLIILGLLYLLINYLKPEWLSFLNRSKD